MNIKYIIDGVEYEYGEQSLSGRKATLILDGTEHTVTFE